MRRLGVAVCVLLGRRHCTRSQDAVGTHVGVRSRRTVASGATGRRITAIFALLTVVLTVGAASCRAPPARRMDNRQSCRLVSAHCMRHH